MKLQRDKELRDYIRKHAGEEGLKLAQLLEQLGEATDTELSAKTKHKPSHIRKVLYALYEARAAEYEQKKDKETGWQTFHWRLNLQGAKHAMGARKQRAVEALEKEIEAEQGARFFECPQGHGRYDYGQAMGLGFECPSCKSMLMYEEKNVHEKELKQKLKDLKDG